jgi:hypothetical protein
MNYKFGEIRKETVVTYFMRMPDNRRLRRYLPNDLPARF